MLIKSFWVALSVYSVIPVPQYKWDDHTTKYSICFFPTVGIPCGMALAIWFFICNMLNIGALLFASVATAIPLLVTGGIHMDGYMDTADALSSHQSKERKLEIMKDSHCGAFSVICCVIYLVLMLGIFHELYTLKLIPVVCSGFVLSRALSGLCAVNLPNARKTGMLAAITMNTQKKRTNIALTIFGLLSCIGMVYVRPISGAVGILFAFLWVLYYRHMTHKQFGGITGDTSGFFLQVCEILLMIGVLVGGLL